MVKAEQGAKIKLLWEKKKGKVIFLLSRRTKYFQVYTVHSSLVESSIEDNPKLQKNLGKGAEVEQEPVLVLWVEPTDSHIHRYSCSKLESKSNSLGRGTD